MVWPEHFPQPTATTVRATIELPDANVTTRRPFGFSRALPSAHPVAFVEQMAQQLHLEDASP